MVVALIRQLLTVASGFGFDLFVGASDVHTAFDEMDHAKLELALRSRGLSFWATANLIREVSGFRAKMVIPTAGTTDLFDIVSGGKQGGAETPDEWNAYLEWIMTPLVHA